MHIKTAQAYGSRVVVLPFLREKKSGLLRCTKTSALVLETKMLGLSLFLTTWELVIYNYLARKIIVCYMSSCDFTLHNFSPSDF